MALGLIPDLLGSFLGGKKKGGDLVDTTPSWLQELGRSLGDQLNTAVKSYVPGQAYSGNLNFSGSPTQYEGTGLAQLGKWLNAPNTGDLFAAGRNQLSDTLAGKYADPTQSPLLQAMAKLSGRQLEDAITQARGQRGARGTYYTDAGVREEGLLRERTLNNLQAETGKFIEAERQRMLDAADTAKGFDQYENMTAPIAKIDASQTYGGLERTIEQANLESQYQDFKRQRDELSGANSLAGNLVVNQQQITPGQMRSPEYFAKNDFGRILDVVNNLLSQAGGSMSKGSGTGQGGLMQLLPLLLGSI